MARTLLLSARRFAHVFLIVAGIQALNGQPAQVAPATRPSAVQALAETTFVNPIAEGADPWVYQHGAAVYWCFSDANRAIAVHRSDRLTALGEKHIVWRAPASGAYSRQLWAPELHRLDNRWYVYVGASDGKNENHRMIVLESERDDPLSPFHFKSVLYTGDSIATGQENRWAIDGTILELGGKRYHVWSGWADHRDIQWLYIAPMSNPWTISGNRVRLCANDDFVWERVGEKPGERGLHEAPQVLQRDGRTFLIYSASSSWQPTYKLGMLELTPGADPMDPNSWRKHPKPVFQSTARVYGVGHNAFAKSPDGHEDWLLFHAKQDRADGWKRAIYLQPFQWNADGTPNFGEPLAPRTPLSLPAGEAVTRPAVSGGAYTDNFGRGLGAWDYFGHHGLLRSEPNGLHLGGEPGWHVNAYSSGEKLVLRDRGWDDCSVSTRVRIERGGRIAGILLRTSAVSLGFDAQRAYFAGISAERNEIVLGFTNGEKWEQLAQADVGIAYQHDYTLEFTASGEHLSVMLDGKPILRARDQRLAHGTVGLRVVNAEAVFNAFAVTPASK